MARTVLPNSNRRSSAPKDDVIQIRTSSSMKAVLTRAAALRGQKLSEFMLDCTLREAEDTILGQCTFLLDTEQHERFLVTLDSPPAPSERLQELFRRKPTWEY